MTSRGILSTLVRQQLPEFIQQNYDTFVAFIEAYYEYLEQSGKATDFGKHLRNYQDVDRTLTEFEDYFSKQFLPLFPKETFTDKMFLLQHGKQFFRTKGSEQAFRFLFRALYGQEIDLFYPKHFVLRASDGRWVRRQSLRFEPTFFSIETGDGSATQFPLFEVITDSDEFAVYLDDVLQSTSAYTYSPNYPHVTFNTPPGSNVEVKFAYSSGEIVSQFNDNSLMIQFTGQQSNASAISEQSSLITVSNAQSLEVFISSLSGTFRQGETVSANTTNSEGDAVALEFDLFSILEYIEVVDGGSSYNVGDPVIITGGSPSIAASAIIDSVYEAVITNIIILNGGAGFRSGDAVVIISTPNTGLAMSIDTVNKDEFYHPNTIYLNTDVISLYANVVVNTSNYGFPGSFTENVDTRLVDALTPGALAGLGPINSVQILSSTFEFATPPTLDAEGPLWTFTSNTAANTTANGAILLENLGVLGRMNVHAGGEGYRVGDELNFAPPLANTGYFGFGYGAAGEVTEVHSSNNGIKHVEFFPSRIAGTVNTSLSGISVIGTGTAFVTDLRVGERIEVNSEYRYVNSITNATHCTVNAAWHRTSTGRRIGVWGHYVIGGLGYTMNTLPAITITSANALATGANVIVDTILGDGENLYAFAAHAPGAIESIAVTNPGSGYQNTPLVDLTGTGDGLATAIAHLMNSNFTYPGKFITTDSLLSSVQRLQGRNYYQNFSYVIQSQVEFSRYRQTLLDLIHPSGMRMFGEYAIEGDIGTANELFSTDSYIGEITLDGTVETTNASNLVVGTGTTFNVANAANTLTIGSTITINTMVLVVATIINNTSLRVANTATLNTSGETLIVRKTL